MTKYVVDKVSEVIDILEDAEIDQIPIADWKYTMNKGLIISALKDGKLNILTLVDAFTEISRVIYKINEAVNE